MAFDFIRALKSALATHPDDELRPLFTPWGEKIIDGEEVESGKVLQDYPRPLLERESYLNLNGWWEYAIRSNVGDEPSPPEEFDGPILVPFSPEAFLSGVGKTLSPDVVLWYKRPFVIERSPDKRCLLNFEAVDFECDCWVDGMFVGHHEGGYLPFSFDITSSLDARGGSEHEILVLVKDPTETDVQPRGKQRLERGSIWYTAQSGIWQTVWLEEVPYIYVRDLLIKPDLDSKKLHVTLLPNINAKELDAADASLSISADNVVLASQSGCHLTEEGVCLELELDEVHPWTPEDPFIYDLDIRLGDDAFKSYCAFRTCTVEKNRNGVPRFCLNHEPYYLRGLLDQGYWPDGLMTAPTDDALIFDIEFAKKLGFNMLRKHIKIECRRWYYHCDMIGMLVWQDMVNGGQEYSSFHTNKFPTVFPKLAANYNDETALHRFGSQSERSKKLWLDEAILTIQLLRNHPSICTWVVFNEGWGQFNANEMTGLLKLEDDSRPFDQASGWFDQGGGDYVSEHNYFRDLHVPIDHRHGSNTERASVITEFGGAAYHLPAHSSLDRAYGYDVYTEEDGFRKKVRSLLDEADALEEDGLSGYVYTQLSDIEEEVNGLITYDRRIQKF